MPIRLTGRRALLGKPETIYSTDAVPTGVANAFYAFDVTITPLEIAVYERNPVRPFFGPDAPIPGQGYAKLDFSVYLAGAGVAGTAAAYGPAMRGVGMSETLAPAVDATYAFISGAQESVTWYVNEDGTLHKLTGARAVSMGIEYNLDDLPIAKFSYIGIYSAPTDTALPTLTLTAWKDPLPVNKANTQFTLHGINARLWKFGLNVANDCKFTDPVNGADSVIITGRKVTGSVAFEADTMAIKDWYAAVTGGTRAALSLTHGTVAGAKVQHTTGATAQITKIGYGDQDGVRTHECDLVFPPSAAGNDEFTTKVL